MKRVSELTPVYCMKCGRMLAKIKGDAEIKCKSCKTFNSYSK